MAHKCQSARRVDAHGGVTSAALCGARVTVSPFYSQRRSQSEINSGGRTQKARCAAVPMLVHGHIGRLPFHI